MVKLKKPNIKIVVAKEVIVPGANLKKIVLQYYILKII